MYRKYYSYNDMPQPVSGIHKKEELKRILEQKDIKIRVNTNGHANRFAGKDVTPEMKGLIDVISISLNAENAEK